MALAGENAPANSEALVGTISLIIMVALATKACFILRNEYLADPRESTGAHFGSNKVRLKIKVSLPTSTFGANVNSSSGARVRQRLAPE
jgi:hypothetical protein